MTRRLATLPGSMALAAILSLGGGMEARADTVPSGPANPQLAVPTPILRATSCLVHHTVPFQRGVAILPPAESPDYWDPGVGGKTIFTPYYPDYSPHRQHGPRVGVPGNGVGYVGRRVGVGVPGPYTPDSHAEATGEPGYGNFTGARKDETNLSHLGGFSGVDAGTQSPAPDLLDEIRSGR